jgi:uncharacterized protein YbbC (DUF1343 family)
VPGRISDLPVTAQTAVVKTGCDIIDTESCRRLTGKRVGLLVNPASVTRTLRSTVDVLVSNGVKLDRLFGPQHGIRGDTQANMIEWEGFTDPVLGIPVYSLYGAHRAPTRGMLEELDCVVIDLPDVGARPYTYLWTSLLMMRACAEAGIEVIVLDRPNPLGGAAVEGPLLTKKCQSFVGLFPLPMRHGLTIAEALAMMDAEDGIGCELRIVKMRGWDRAMLFGDTSLPWVPPSPNMPTPDTALVYPGTVLLEGTNISEGRGTTRPFEIVGAPWIEPRSFAAEVSSHGLRGVLLRPLYFSPAWDKYAHGLCGGIQVHVTDREKFRPVRCGTAIIASAKRLYPDHFQWKEPPYEYEYERAPIDIISGSPALREAVDSGHAIASLFEAWEDEEKRFRTERGQFLLYHSL